MSSLTNHLVLGLSRFLFHSFSIPRSFLTAFPTYHKAACSTHDSSVRSGLMFSRSHVAYIMWSINPSKALIPRLRHPNSNPNALLFSSQLSSFPKSPFHTAHWEYQDRHQFHLCDSSQVFPYLWSFMTCIVIIHFTHTIVKSCNTF